MKLANMKCARSIFAGLLLPLLSLTGITSEGFSADSIFYHYDALDRLDQVVHPDGTNIHYAYDNVGNRLSQDIYQVTATLSASPASPQPSGTSVTFTGFASGGTGNYEYEFRGRHVGGGVWGIGRAFGANPSWVWPAAPGSYEVQVNVRHVGSDIPFEATASIVYSVTFSPVDNVTITASPSSPQLQGTSITFTGAATGGSGPCEYKFWGRMAGAPSWSIAREYSTNNSWAWDTTGVFAGTYEVKVDARVHGSTSEYEATSTSSFVVTVPPVDNVALSSSPASPQSAGTQVTFTGAATGGSGLYEYEFWGRRLGQSFGIARSYSQTPTWVWTAGAANNWEIKVNVRNVGSTAPYEATATIPYQTN